MIRPRTRKTGFAVVAALVSIVIVVFLFSSHDTAAAETQKGAPRSSIQSDFPITFNHDATSFALLGAHRTLKCAQCHLGGQYKGIPRTCENCHNNQIAYGKPQNHLATTQGCSFCHAVAAWTPATFQHNIALSTGQCSTCHNGQKATGKPQKHINTTGQCDTCHKITGWVPAGYMHDAGTIGRCSTCHNSQTATGKPSSHLLTMSQCDTCHRTTGWIPAVIHDASAAGQCATCHRVGGAGLPPKVDILHNNLAGQDCSACHTSTTTFDLVRMNHLGIVAPCSTCHYTGNTVEAVSKPADHIVTSMECNLCHAGTTTFANGVFNHLAVTGLCSTCHRVGGAGMPPRVDVVHNNLAGKDCSACHSSTTSFSLVKMNHLGITAPCSTCHYTGNNVGAASKPSNHIVTTQECNLCHAGTTTFANGVFNHTGITGLCSSCHRVGGPGLPPRADVLHNNLAGKDCNSCHSSTTSFDIVKMNHLGLTASCTTCHYAGNNVGAEAKPSDHPPTAQDCGACHTTSTFDK